ncbi:MAG: hypothetical protein HC769_18100 [Cyanobacteria bacterium CRU_2_1]|nr:hypothetical protein [Cyanobacteria bacterium CRU_2_1]
MSSQLNPDWLQQALQSLLSHHDALRLRFQNTELGWYQHHGSIEDLPLQVQDLSGLEPRKQKAILEQESATCQASLQVSEGSLLQGILFQRGENQSSYLLLVIHHLVVDGVSWRILLEDLSQGYTQLQQGRSVQLPAKTTSFKAWACRLQAYATSTLLREELAYWQGQKAATVSPVSLPLDFGTEMENIQETAAQVMITLSAEETQTLLQAVPAVYNTQINDVLLTALVQGFSSWMGVRSLCIDLEGHGREDLFEDVDLSRTVGWFTTLFPVVLHLEDAAGPGEALKSVKEQLRQLPHRGIGYGVLKYLHPDKAVRQSLRQLPPAPISFNYLGQFDQLQALELESGLLLGLASESAGANRHPKGRRSHLLEISGRVMDGQLQMEWSYSQKLHRSTTIESLANHFKQSLLTLIDHCLDPAAGGFTPSDFPLANLDEQQLDQVTTLLQELTLLEELNNAGD